MVWTSTGPLHRGERGSYDRHGHWWPETPTLPDSARTLPETVPHEVISAHRLSCRCTPCGRYPQDVRQRLQASRPARRRT